VEKITDQTGWLWWGSNRKITPPETKNFLYTIHAITSGWRPNQVLCNIATKNLPELPFEVRGAKANYWYGQGITPQANVYQESLYVAKHFTLGSLWTGFGGQMTRFQLVADGPDGGIVFTGGNPRKSDHTGKILDELTYEDGNGRYDQSAQVGSSYVSISDIPETESLAYSFFSIPDGASKPVLHGKWWVMQAGETFVGVYPLSGKGGIGESEMDEVQKAAAENERKHGRAPQGTFPILRFEGRHTGFILEAADTGRYPSLDAFTKALAAVRVDDSQFESALAVGYTNLDGKNIEVQYQNGQSHVKAAVDGKPVVFENWNVYESPCVSEKDSTLTVNDGREGFVVDFTGALPVYKPWIKPAAP